MGRSPVRRFFAVLFFILAAVAFVGFVFLAYASSRNDTTVLFGLAKKLDTVAYIAGAIILFVILILLLLLVWRTGGKREPEAEAEPAPEEWAAAPLEEAELLDFSTVPDAAEPAEPAPAPTTPMAGEVVAYDLATTPVMYRAWTPAEDSIFPFVYPRTVRDGIYSNTYIPIDNTGRQLKLRILLAGPAGAQLPPLPEGHDRHIAPNIAQPAPGRKEPAPRPKATPNGVWYDYTGDNHDVEDLEGIGPVYGKRLRAMGIETSARLRYESPGRIARDLDVPLKTVRSWQNMAELVKVKGVGPQYAEAMARAGVEGIEDLKKRNARAISEQVMTYLGGLKSTVIKQPVTPVRVASWKKEARKMKRVRQEPPAR